jgi:molecular chaperone DnaK
MVQEAEKYKDEDRKRKELIELRNQADAYAYTVEKSLRDLHEKISEEQKKKIEEGINKLKESLKGEDINRIRQDFEELQRLWTQIAQEVYAKYGSQAQSESTASDSKKDKPDDTDYEVVK